MLALLLLAFGTATAAPTDPLQVSARSLYDLGLPVASEAPFVELLDRGPADPAYDEALAHLVRIAALTDDWSQLRARILDVPQDRWPKQEKDWLAWLRARALFAGVVDRRGGDAEATLTEARKLLGSIPLSAEAALRARYLAGLVHGRLGKPHHAHNAFVDVLRAIGRHDGDLVSEPRAAELDRCRERVVFALAALYVHAGLYPHAVNLTRHVPFTSPRRAEADLLLAWMAPGAPRKGRPVGAAAPRLEAMIHDAGARDPCAERPAALQTLRTAETTFRPLHAQTGATLERWTAEAALDDPDLQHLEWIYRHVGEAGVSAELKAELGTLAEVATVRGKLARITRERGVVEAERGSWREGVGDAAAATLDAEALRLEKLGGAALLARVTSEQQRLGALLDAATGAAAFITGLPCPARPTD
ncbi:MAG: hypothetical protein V4850_15655 [Myxococcota bacterium]